MFIYTDQDGEIITIAEKDILTVNSYRNKYEIPDNVQIPKNLHLYIYDGTKFILKSDAINKVLRLRKKQVSKATEIYIEAKLEEIDEDLADITSKALILEGRILTIAGGKISSDEVKEKIARFLSGQYTQEDAVAELQQKQLSKEQINKILKILQRAVEIAKILAWKEKVWEVEETLEEALEDKKLSELENLDVKQLVEEAYEKIPLEV